jgi:two-component system, OmpR family, osmolarity sensor histidine kinase EnvZ
MRRLGLVWRIALIVVAAFFILQLVIAGVFLHERSRITQVGLRLPLPDQVAALATLLDHAAPDQQSLLLRAVNGAGLHAELRHDRPADIDTGREMERVENALRKYLAAPADRFVAARLIDGPQIAAIVFPRLRGYLDSRAEIVVSLASGDYLVVESADQLVPRLFGLPTGFWAGIVGFVIAVIAILAVIRETLPLSRLADSVERFGADLEPKPMRERGAREVRALIRAVNQMQSRIAALVKGRAFVIGAIAHDLRTYLTRLRLRVETLPDSGMRERAGRDVEDMSALLEDALSFAQASFVGAENEVVDLVTVARRECDERAAAGMPVTATLPATPVAVRGSAAALARMVGNLVDNAVKYGGRAEVAVLASPAHGEILVEDRGPGIPAAERESIFEPFRRLEPSRNRARGGAGLGLAIAHRVAEGHGGSIAIEDRPGGGARFRVRLPRWMDG